MPADPNNVVSVNGSYFPPVLVTGTVAYYQITNLNGVTQIYGLVRCSLPCTGVLVGSGGGDQGGGSVYGAPSAGMCVVDLSANTYYTLFLPEVSRGSALDSTLTGTSTITTTSNTASGGGPGESGAINTFGLGTGGADGNGGYGFGAGGGGGSSTDYSSGGGGGGGFDPNAYYGITGLSIPSAKNGGSNDFDPPQGAGAPSVLFLQVNLTETIAPGEPVDSEFNGVLVDNTTYSMTEPITRETEFTLADGSTGVGIVWNGNGFTITANKSGWFGLFPCAVNVSNLGILSDYTTAVNAGWFFRANKSGSATNCYSTGPINEHGGGIFGYQSAGVATNCYSTGPIGYQAGGIFGNGGGTATNCFSSGIIGARGGGIFGGAATGTAENCYSTGDIGDDGGGIFGRFSDGSAINCYTTGALGLDSGEIFGLFSTVTVTNSGHSAGWNDTDASTYLTGTPETSPGVGSVWVSVSTNTPYALATMPIPEAPIITTTTTTISPLIFTSMTTIEDVYLALESNTYSEVLAAAISANLSPEITLLAFAEYAATNGTAIFSSYIGAYEGANATISAANAVELYISLGITDADAAKDLYISVPSAGVLTLGPTTMNTSLAIDDTVDATYSFAGYTGYTLTVIGGVQTFTSPSGSTVLSQGSTITFTNSSGTITYPVLHLDLTLGAGALGDPPVCFFGDAPVKTPSGYRRIDSLKVGDRVSTPTGSAVIEVIHCQNYVAGPSSNPYVIPKGRFGATQELFISPRHRVSVGGQMVEARYLGLKQKDVGTLTYYNLGLEGWADMIVAGVLVESLAPIRRVTISREEFKRTMEKQGRITPEIAASHFYANHVCMPILRK